MKKCMLAACSAVGILLCTGGCGSHCSDAAASDVVALRGEVDQLKSEVARLKARVSGVEARATRVAVPGENGGKPNFTGSKRPPISKERIDEMRRRHEERVKARQHSNADAAAVPAGDESAKATEAKAE